MKKSYDDNCKNIIISIINDSKKHIKLLKKFYTYYSNDNYISLKKMNFNENCSYLEALKKAALNTYNNIDNYIKLHKLIIESLSNDIFINMTFEIIQEAQKNASQINYVLILTSLDNQNMY